MPIEVFPSREAHVAGARVRRALPQRLGADRRRTVGAWCFADHLGPVHVTPQDGMDVGPHPHIGLQTVTWLTAGELLHRDSIGSEQLIRSGQLNLMTAGAGVSHAEENAHGYDGRLEGIQLWVAQPDRTRGGPAAFEHHAALPQVELHGEKGSAVVTALVGEFGTASSPARRDTDHAGFEILLRPGSVTVPLRPDYEYAVVVLEGAAHLHHPGGAGARLEPGRLGYLGDGHDELTMTAEQSTRLMLLGGVPFEAPVVMWWNFVARDRSEIAAARTDWEAGTERFGSTGSALERIGAPELPPTGNAPS